LIPNVDNLVTEDDTPVDNFFSEKQQRLLTSCLYSSPKDEKFICAANVGIFHTVNYPPIVPDVFLSLDVTVPDNWWEKGNRSYFNWQFGKPPEVVIEIVSNKIGEELDNKLKIYEKMRVSYYVVYDPNRQLSSSVLRIFELKGTRYFETSKTWLEQVKLGLTLWTGIYEQREDTWLRWCYPDGTIVPTGDEIAQQAQQRAENAEQRAESAEQRAESAEQTNKILVEKLRSLGIDPDTL
jgi:Uma2 family endonuclease